MYRNVLIRAAFGASLFCASLVSMGGAAGAQSASLGLGLSHSSKHGAAADATLTFEQIGGRDLDLSLSYKEGEKGYGGGLSLRYGFAAENGDWVLRLSAGDQDWSTTTFAASNITVSLDRDWQMSGFTTLSLGGFARQDNVKRIDDQGLAFLKRDKGLSWTGGLRAGWLHDTGTPERGVATQRRSVSHATLTYGFLGERNYAALEVGTRQFFPLGESWAIDAGLSLGAIRGAGEQHVSVMERVFLGSPDPRGFAFGGLGPRHVGSGQSMGGTDYYVGRVEVQHDIWQNPLFVSGFLDIASVWGLPGAERTDFSSLDQSPRVSAGLAFNWASEIGTVSVSFAEVLAEKKSDVKQAIGLSLDMAF